MLQKLGVLILTLIFLFVPTVGMAIGTNVELEVDTQTDIEVQVSAENEDKLSGSILTEGFLNENGQYNLSYNIELSNDSMNSLEDIKVALTLPENINLASYLVVGVEAIIVESKEGLTVTLPHLESELSHSFNLNVILEAEQELEVITTPISVSLDGTEVFLADFNFRLASQSDEENSNQDEAVDDGQEVQEGTEGNEGNEGVAEENELPKTGSFIGNWLWITLGLTMIGSGLYFYKKSNWTAT
jgi:LPXTG-motif cell wall-anchored protein